MAKTAVVYRYTKYQYFVHRIILDVYVLVLMGSTTAHRVISYIIQSKTKKQYVRVRSNCTRYEAKKQYVRVRSTCTRYEARYNVSHIRTSYTHFIRVSKQPPECFEAISYRISNNSQRERERERGNLGILLLLMVLMH